MPRLRKRRDPDRPDGPVIDVKAQRAAQRAAADRRASILPTDAGLDQIADITDEDIDRAVDLWDASQIVADTGLDGMLDARLMDA